MKQLRVLLAVILVGVGAALTYHIFENSVHGFINYVWYETFNTDVRRWIVLPLTLVFSTIFFGLQHHLDPKSENASEHGLGNMPTPTATNFVKVLIIGFFSLVAGAALGPEAILVPACMIIGGYVGVTMFDNDEQITKLLAAAGLMALFTAFFDSFWIGVASLLLVLGQSKTKFKPILLVVAVLASASSKIALNALEGEAFAPLPSYPSKLSLAVIIGCLVLIVAGYLVIRLMSIMADDFGKLRRYTKNKSWLVHAAVAGIILAALALIGGPLVEFTGNKSIQPMFSQATSLGLAGLLWVLVFKVAIISYSKAIGYRGGMIFPTIFVATVLVAIVQLYVTDFHIPLGVIAVLIGAFVANKKTKILI